MERNSMEKPFIWNPVYSPKPDDISTSSEDIALYKEELEKAHQTIASLEKNVLTLQETIESIKAQYATLMDTATQYRDEAKKWYLVATRKQ